MAAKKKAAVKRKASPRKVMTVRQKKLAATKRADVLENKKREAFAHEYVLNGNNGTQAYLAAGYKCTTESAWSLAHRMLRNVKVRERVSQLQTEYHEQLMHTREQMLQEIDSCAHWDPIEMFDEDGNLLQLHEMPPTARKMVNKIELAMGADDQVIGILKVEHGKDKRAYLDMMAKIRNEYDHHQKAGSGVIIVQQYCEADAHL